MRTHTKIKICCFFPLVSGLDHDPVRQADENIVGRVTVERLLETLLVDELESLALYLEVV
jgi:hypothetical protein